MAARERITEIAVFRTLGFQKATILALVLGESVFIALASGVFGILLFVAAQPSLRRFLLASPMSSLAATFHLYPEILGLAFALAVGIGVLAGLVPALRSASRSIADGLRQVA
jgi:putative ABC transport system permease protein